MQRANMNLRIGQGYDIHRLKAGGRLVLGGVVVSDVVSAIAHSDGDVVIHAIVDAILGALGRGDIGEHFPDSDPSYRGAASNIFLEKVAADASGAGFRVVNVDVTVLAEHPKLQPYKAEMVASLKRVLGDDDVVINIKAGTNEGCGEIGWGEAVAAHAVVLLANRQ